jgi:acyl carrier protein
MSEKEDRLYAEIALLIGEVDEDLQERSTMDIRGKSLTEDLGLDSLDVIKFVLLLEEKLGCKIPDEDIDRHDLMNLDNLVAYLVAR